MLLHISAHFNNFIGPIPASPVPSHSCSFQQALSQQVCVNTPLPVRNFLSDRTRGALQAVSADHQQPPAACFGGRHHDAGSCCTLLQAACSRTGRRRGRLGAAPAAAAAAVHGSFGRRLPPAACRLCWPPAAIAAVVQGRRE